MGRKIANLVICGVRCRPMALTLSFFFFWRSELALDFRGESSLLPFEPHDQYLQRQKKLAEIEARGHDAYPHKFVWTATPAELVEKYTSADTPAPKPPNPPSRPPGPSPTLPPPPQPPF